MRFRTIDLYKDEFQLFHYQTEKTSHRMAYQIYALPLPRRKKKTVSFRLAVPELPAIQFFLSRMTNDMSFLLFLHPLSNRH